MSNLQQKYIKALSLESKIYPYLIYKSGVLVENTLNNKKRSGFYILNNFKKMNFCIMEPQSSMFYYTKTNLAKVSFVDTNWQHIKSGKDNYIYNIIDTGNFLQSRSQNYFLFSVFSGFLKVSSEKFLGYNTLFNGLKLNLQNLKKKKAKS
jgi:DNA-binding PadR family transcriptional regulator